VIREGVVHRLDGETGELESLQVDLADFDSATRADPIGYLGLLPLERFRAQCLSAVRIQGIRGRGFTPGNRCCGPARLSFHPRRGATRRAGRYQDHYSTVAARCCLTNREIQNPLP
jgi:hypothetical protein